MLIKIVKQSLISSSALFKIRYFLCFCLINTLSLSSVHAADTKKETKATQQQALKKISSQVKFKARADHKFLLTADYLFFPKKADAKLMPGVIVLHDCHHQRSDYNALTKSIAEQGLHTLALDFRGYGESVAEGYSEIEVKKHAKDIVSYQSEVALLTSYWPQDLLAAYKYLRSKVDNSRGISVVAGGCAANYAVALAEQVRLTSLVLLTPEMSYADKERYKNLIDIPSYFIGSAHHMASISTARELFDWNGASQSKMQIFKGDKSNYKLIRANKYLVNDVAQWLKYTLR